MLGHQLSDIIPNPIGVDNFYPNIKQAEPLRVPLSRTHLYVSDVAFMNHSRLLDTFGKLRRAILCHDDMISDRILQNNIK